MSAEDWPVVVRRSFAQDERLSLRSRGLVLVALAQPPDWRLTIDRLRELSPEGREAIRTALCELEGYGYFYRERVPNGYGLINWTQSVSDSPLPPSPTPLPLKARSQMTTSSSQATRPAPSVGLRTAPAGDLVSDGSCSPQCLLAGDADAQGQCRCRCRGAYHGALTGADVKPHPSGRRTA